MPDTDTSVMLYELRYEPKLYSYYTVICTYSGLFRRLLSQIVQKGRLATSHRLYYRLLLDL